MHRPQVNSAQPAFCNIRRRFRRPAAGLFQFAPLAGPEIKAA
jgi:hypothetical protein